MKKIILAATILLSFGALSQEFTELMKVVASDRDTEDRLGWSSDISGDFAIVGAYADDFGATNPNMGSAYIYQKIGGEWVEVQKIFNSDQDDYDRFGWSVAIDGDYCIVGAYGEDHDAADGASMSKAGSAYVFERNDEGVWEEVQKLVAGDRAEDDEFGWSVAIHGTTAVVGAHIDDKNAAGFGSFYHAGSAYVFDRDDEGNWTQSQKIVASDRSPGTVYADDHEDWNDRFGESVAIWNDYIVVGGPFASKAYAFERTDDVWSEVAFLTFPGISWLDRAAPVSIDSTTIILGAQTEDLNADGEESILNSGGAAVFKRTDGTWSYTQKLSPADRNAGDHFGISVSIDGNYIVVGTHSDNHDEDGGDEIENTGSVYVFELQEDGTYLEITKLDASDRAEDDELGISVSISENTIIAGAFQQSELPDGGDYLEDAGAAYFYEMDDGCETVFYTQEAVICAGSSFEVGESSYDESGVYTDELETDEGCDSVVTTILEVEDAPIYEQEVSICFGASYEIGESTYDESGVYTDILEADGGCDSIVITYLEVEELIEVEQEFLLCPGESITVGDMTYSEEGIYVDELETDEGCDSLVYTIIEVAAPINTEVNNAGLFLEALADDVDYQWIKCDPYEVIDGADEFIYVPEENGEYAVIIYDGECSDTSDCYEITSIGIGELTFNSVVSIYPNPSNGSFNISGDNLIGTQLEIFNPLGELIHSTSLTSNQNLIDLSSESNGLYLVKLTNESGTKVERLALK